jgi:hypothetical protein
MPAMVMIIQIEHGLESQIVSHKDSHAFRCATERMWVTFTFGCPPQESLATFSREHQYEKNDMSGPRLYDGRQWNPVVDNNNVSEDGGSSSPRPIPPVEDGDGTIFVSIASYRGA